MVNEWGITVMVILKVEVLVLIIVSVHWSASNDATCHYTNTPNVFLLDNKCYVMVYYHT